MSYLLRKFSLSKWQKNVSKQPNQYTADAITGCTRTQKNTLSVWHSSTYDFDSQEFKDLAVALATTMDKPDAMDFIWLIEEHLAELGIEVRENPGLSPFESQNEKHRDLIDINHEKLAVVGEHIVGQMEEQTNYKKITRSELLELVNHYIETQQALSEDDLSEKWIEALQKYRAQNTS